MTTPKDGRAPADEDQGAACGTGSHPSGEAAPASSSHSDFDPSRTRAAQVADQCRVVAHLARALGRVHEDYVKLVEIPAFREILDQVGRRSADLMEVLGDALNEMDATQPGDGWIDPIFKEAQKLFPPRVSDEHPQGENASAVEGEACQRDGEAEKPTLLPPSPDPSRTDDLVIPPGWRLVPEEPTEEMIQAKCEAELRFNEPGGGADRAWVGRMMAAGYRAMLVATPSAPAPGPAEGAQSGDGPQLERVRHRERGAEYEVLGEAEVQISTRSTCPDGVGNGVLPKSTIIREGRAGYESDRLVVYRCVKTGKLWCRLPDEFRDGRFESLDRCIACEEVIRDGDLVLPDAEGGYIHRACCGPERESFTGADGEPLKDGAPTPEGRPYRAEVEHLDRQSPPTAQAERQG